MCVTYFAWQHPQLPDLLLLVAFNREEVLERPTAPSHFWEDRPSVLGGRDLVAGGTWLCASTAGRAAFLTNFRELRDTARVGAPSRGALPVSFATSEAGPEEFLGSLDCKAYPGFNLMAADFVRQRMAYLCNKSSSRQQPQPQLVPPGLHGITNGHIDEHWPKIEAGRQRLQQLIDSGAFAGSSGNGGRCDGSGAPGSGPNCSDTNAGAGCNGANGATAGSKDSSSGSGGGCSGGGGSGGGGSGGGGGGGSVPWEDVFSLLSDDTVLERDPERLPATGYGHRFESAASSIFMQPIDTASGLFGTRCQTVLAVWRDGRAEWRERYIVDDGSWQQACHCFRVQVGSGSGSGSQEQQQNGQHTGKEDQQQQQQQQQQQ